MDRNQNKCVSKYYAEQDMKQAELKKATQIESPEKTFILGYRCGSRGQEVVFIQGYRAMRQHIRGFLQGWMVVIGLFNSSFWGSGSLFKRH